MMKRLMIFTVVLCLIFQSSIVLSQKKKEPEKKAIEKKEKKESSEKKSGPDGYGNLQWSTPLNKAKEAVAGKITYIDEKRVIISRDGDIEYFYGFIFIDPAIMKKDDSKKDSAKPEEKSAITSAPEARLYYVSIRFPYISMDEVKKRIEEKYGVPTGEDIRNNQGALIWDSEKTTIVMWIDRYENKPFSRKITYVSKAIAKEANDYQDRIFNKTELEIMKRISP